MESKRRSVLGIVFLIVFLDMLGFSVIFPLFPAMLEHYLEREGDSSTIGRLVGFLAGLVGGENADFKVAVLFGCFLGSLYSLLQFLFAPFWGALSDRIGRRPTLIVTLAGTALSYVLWFVSGSFVVLIAARLIGGIMAGNISTASAVVADVSEAEDRAKGMGMLGAGIGLGFVLGPALGALASGWNLLGAWPDGAAFGVNPFSAAALAALALALFNLIWTVRKFPETLPPEKRGEGASERTRNPFRALRAIDSPGVMRASFVYFLYFTAFSAIEFTLSFLTVERLAFEPRDIGIMFVFVGLVIAFVQGGLVRRLAPRFGEKRLTLVGLLFTIPGFVCIGLAQSTGVLYLGLAFMAFASAIATPCLTALVSRYSPVDRQGLALGAFRSMGALSRAIGPVIGGVLYFSLGSGAPYYGGAAFLLFPVALALALPAVAFRGSGAAQEAAG